MPKKVVQQESIFDSLEQYHPLHDEYHYILLKRINVMSFESFEFESLFLFFENFMRYIPRTSTRSKIFNAMNDIKIIIDLIYEEHKDIEQCYAGHSIQCHMDYLLEISINIDA